MNDFKTKVFEGRSASEIFTEWQSIGNYNIINIEIEKWPFDNYHTVTVQYTENQKEECNESNKTIQEMLSDHYNKENQIKLDKLVAKCTRKRIIRELNSKVLDNIAPKTEKHKEICDKLNQIYADKNSDYGDSFAISYYLFGMTGVLQRLFDKWIRMYMLQYKSQKVNDESIVDSLRDLTNYSIMTLIELENDNPNDPARRLAEALKELAGIDHE